MTLFSVLMACTPKLEKRLTAMMVEKPDTQALKDKNELIKYAIEKELDVEITESGLMYIIESPGVGERFPTDRDKITAHYTGTLLNGKKFDSSVDRGTPLDFQLGRVIPGWQEAIKLMKKGGKGKFLIPSDLGYGTRGAGTDIPPNSPLVFDIELIDYIDPIEAVDRQKDIDDTAISTHLADKGIDVQKTASGIYYSIETPGSGEHPNAGAQVKVHYEGSLLNGKVFDSSIARGEPITFGLHQVIPGWQEAVLLLKKGGKGTFWIPSGLAYGPNGAGGVIPGNAPLAFKIELIDF